MRQSGYGLSHDEVVEWVRKSTASQGLPEKVTDPTILRKVAILMRPELAGRSMPPIGRSLGKGSPGTRGPRASGRRAAEAVFEHSKAHVTPDLVGPLTVGLSDADCLQLERATARMLHALEARRGQIRRD
jgi:hypothetical protein